MSENWVALYPLLPSLLATPSLSFLRKQKSARNYTISHKALSRLNELSMSQMLDSFMKMALSA